MTYPINITSLSFALESVIDAYNEIVCECSLHEFIEV